VTGTLHNTGSAEIYRTLGPPPIRWDELVKGILELIYSSHLKTGQINFEVLMLELLTG